ncbi:MAG: hypothetical protein JSS82_10755 [Bacteroidetes bacterium]|nr:hypothetical protein [Bacteroidota bacterium]
MRLLLRTNKGLFQVCWIVINQNSITGWYMGDWLKEDMGLTPNSHLDCHFTYPGSGEYHYSFKSNNSHIEKYINVYRNHVKLKVITRDANGIMLEKTINEMTRHEFAKTGLHRLGHMVPIFEPIPLASAEHFQFCSIGFNVFGGNFSSGKNNIVLDKDIAGEDLVVDVRVLDKFGVSVSCHLKDIGNDFFVRLYQDGQYHAISTRLFQNRLIEITCQFGLNTAI